MIQVVKPKSAVKPEFCDVLYAGEYLSRLDLVTIELFKIGARGEHNRLVQAESPATGFDGMESELVASIEEDHGPGPPYRISSGICCTTCMRTTYLRRVSRRVYGKRFYITIDGTSKTWVSDEWAAEFIKKAEAQTSAGC